MERWWQDLRYAIRVLVKKPGFTAVAVISLALGIGANTAIFTVINAVFLHPLAIEDPSHVVEMFTRDTKTVQSGNFTLTPTSFQNFEDYRDQNSVFSGVAGYFGFGLQWTRDGETQPLPAFMTSANYFDVLGIKPFRGRLFRPDEDRTMGGDTVAVISHSLWTREFGSDPNVIDRKLTLNGLPFTVIGITPPGFKGTFSLAGPDRVWVPLSMREQLTTGQTRQLIANRRFRWVNMAGRLKPGVSMRQADAAMKTIASSLAKEYPTANEGRTLDMALESDAALGINGRGQLVLAGSVMMGVVGLVLLIACVNLANLLLAQSASREKEMSIRAAMGAGRGRIVRQLMTESGAARDARRRCRDDRRVLGTHGVVVVPAAVSRRCVDRSELRTARPAVHRVDVDPDRPLVRACAGDSRLAHQPERDAQGRRAIRRRLGRKQPPSQRAGDVRDRARDRGLDRRGPVRAQHAGGRAHGPRVRFGAHRTVLPEPRTAAIRPGARPAVLHRRDGQGASRSGRRVGNGRVSGTARRRHPADGVSGRRGAESRTTADRSSPSTTSRRAISKRMRIPIKQGRDFTEFDGDQSKAVAVVNEAMARQLWPGQDALSKRFTIVQQTDHDRGGRRGRHHGDQRRRRGSDADDLSTVASGIRARRWRS